MTEQEQTISKVTAYCRKCAWQTTGNITINPENDNPLDKGGTIKNCRQHHIVTKKPIGGYSDHNVFDLKHKERDGFVVVGSRVVGGLFRVESEE